MPYKTTIEKVARKAEEHIASKDLTMTYLTNDLVCPTGVVPQTSDTVSYVEVTVAKSSPNKSIEIWERVNGPDDKASQG